MQIVFLGTSCAKPTKTRNHSTVYLSYGSEGILFDCGEGTQRQLAIAGIKPTKITKVLISHWHGDHVLGLAGLIYTLGLSEYTKKLKIYGPKGTKKFIKNMLDSTVDDARIEMEIKEIEPGQFYEGKEYKLEAYKLDHRGTPTIGYALIEKDRRRIDLKYTKKIGLPEGPLMGKLQEGKDITFKGEKINVEDATTIVKGKKIAYMADTIVCKGAYDLAENADLLIASTTYTSKDKDKAKKHSHITAFEAGQIASQTNVKQLILTHFSTRYKDTHELEQDARNVFDNSQAAKDLMKITL